MPIAVILIGVILLDLAARGTEHEFATQLGADFGSGSKFLTWAAAITAIGALGYVPAIGKVSTLLLALVLTGLILRNGGLFAQLEAAILSPPSPAAAVPLSTYGSSSSSSSSSSSGSSGGSSGGVNLSSVESYASIAALA